MIFEHEGLTIDYELRGEGPTCVLVHGLTVDRRVMIEAFEPLLSKAGVRRLYLDLPGHGVALLRSAAIGCWMGITPGGPTAASFMSYGIAKRFSRMLSRQIAVGRANCFLTKDRTVCSHEGVRQKD